MSADELVVLNVGGVRHTTTLSTLRRFPHSMLGVMFSGQFTPSILRDPHGHVFIDRDGAAFSHVLNFLRTSRLCLPRQFQDYELLEAEADYYQIPELIAACRERAETAGCALSRARPVATGGYFLEVLEFEETAYFYRFYMPQPNRSGNNSAFKSGGLVITGHRDALSSLPLSGATRLVDASAGAAAGGGGAAVAAGGDAADLAVPVAPHQPGSPVQVSGADEPAAPQHQNSSSEYPTMSLPSMEKMSLFHHLAQNGWLLQDTGFAYSIDADGSYIVHKYIWHLTPSAS